MAGGKHGKVVEILLVYGNDLFDSISNKVELPTEDNLLTIIRSGKKLGVKEKLKNRAINIFNRSALLRDKSINGNSKRVLSNDHLIDSISKEAPYLGVKIIDSKLDLEIRKAFSEKFLARLFSDRKSILHMEFSNFDDELDEPIGYWVDPKFSLIKVITNPTTAQSMYFNKSIGEESINFLRSKEFISDINDLDILVDEENLKKYPLYSGIRYIDILVMEALKIQHPWHMWLFYFPHFVSGICEAMTAKRTNAKSIGDEFIEIMFWKMREWILSTTKDGFSFNQVLLKEDAQHQNENILKSAILALVRSSFVLSQSSQVQPDTQNTALKNILSCFIELSMTRNENVSRYANVIISCLEEKFGESNGNVFRSAMKMAWQGYDFVPAQHRTNGNAVIQILRNVIFGSTP